MRGDPGVTGWEAAAKRFGELKRWMDGESRQDLTPCWPAGGKAGLAADPNLGEQFAGDGASGEAK